MNSKQQLIHFITFLAVINSLTCVFCTEDAKSNSNNVHRVATLPTEEQKVTEKSTSVTTKKQWVSRIFLEARINFVMDARVNSECKKDFDLYMQHLRNQTVWAVRMMESSQWPSVGIFAGMTHHMGNYDECLRARAPTFRGQYCLVEGNFNFTFGEELETSTFDWMDYPKEEYSVWSVLKMYRKDLTRVNRQKQFWAICVPSTCKAEDVQISLQRTLEPLFKKYGLSISVNVDPRHCQTKNEQRNQSTQESCGRSCVIKTLFVIYGITLIWASIRDTTKDGERGKDTPCTKLLHLFSIPNNYKSLKAYTPETTDTFIHFLEIVILFLVVIGHRHMLYNAYPTFNTEDDEMMFSKGYMLEYFFFNAVDVYFTISGFLMFQRYMVPIQKDGLVLVFRVIFSSWLRLVWLPGLLMFLFIFNAPYDNNGPFFDFHVPIELEICRSNWWTTLLGLNNIIRPDKICLPHTWFTSVSLQLTIIGGILLYVISKNKKKGFLLATFTFLFSFAVVYITAYRNNYNGMLWAAHRNLREAKIPEEYTKIYLNTFSRVGPYLLGIGAGYLAQTLKAMNYKFSKKMIMFVLLLSKIVETACLLSGLESFNPGKPYEPVKNAIFAALNRTTNTLTATSILLMYHTSELGILKKWTERGFIIVLGRLQYCAYVTGFLLQLFLVLTQRTYIPIVGRFTLYWWSTGDIAWILAIAFVVHLTVEAPINNLIKLLLPYIFIRSTEKQPEKSDSAKKIE